MEVIVQRWALYINASLITSMASARVVLTVARCRLHFQSENLVTQRGSAEPLRLHSWSRVALGIEACVVWLQSSGSSCWLMSASCSHASLPAASEFSFLTTPSPDSRGSCSMFQRKQRVELALFSDPSGHLSWPGLCRTQRMVLGKP